MSWSRSTEIDKDGWRRGGLEDEQDHGNTVGELLDTNSSQRLFKQKENWKSKKGKSVGIKPMKKRMTIGRK